MASGEDANLRAASLGGSLLLKTQHGPAALQRHGFLPVAPVIGELWAFPGYMPHCVMPRAIGSPAESPPSDVPSFMAGAVPSAMPSADHDARQRVSAAFNVYSAVSVKALSLVGEQMGVMLQARDRASMAMDALRSSRERASPPLLPP